MHTKALFAALLGLIVIAGNSGAQDAKWYRGNTHAHTTNSDGNASPEAVARWYREHGYAFVVITDHEHVTNVEPLNAQLAVRDSFLVMSGQEVTQQIVDSTRLATPRQAHVVAIGTSTVIQPLGVRGIATGPSLSETYRRNLGLVREAGGIA
jgi:hypothetical protein